MISARSRNLQFGSMLATAALLLMLPTAGHAYTAGQQQACTGDAFRLCGSDIPNVERITACMIRQRDQLSPGCQVYFKSSDPAPELTPVTLRKHSAIKPKKPRKHHHRHTS